MVVKQNDVRKQKVAEAPLTALSAHMRQHSVLLLNSLAVLDVNHENSHVM